jgi:hypothetical protein
MQNLTINGIYSIRYADDPNQPYYQLTGTSMQPNNKYSRKIIFEKYSAGVEHVSQRNLLGRSDSELIN